MQECSLVFLYKRQEKKILLAMKKRSFGQGKWNGVGGKLEGNETVKGSAIRETREEICVEINENDLVEVATLDFFFENNKEWNQRAYVFFVENWENEPTETEEMNPKWHHIDSLPFEEMWIDDRHWLPRVLNGEKLKATFTFNESGNQILDMKIDKLQKEL